MSIIELWVQHTNSRFPVGYGGRDVNGICVTSIDTYISGCLSSYVKKEDAKIDLDNYQLLQKCQKDLETALPFLDDEAHEYFNRLFDMCSLVILEASIS